jgi:DNA mismatch repair protein MutS2
MQFSAATLEYEALRKLVSRYIGSPLGHVLLHACEPHADRGRLETELAETAEAMDYLRTASKPQPAGMGSAIRIQFTGIGDVSQTLHKLHIEGATLDGREVFDLFAVLDRAADAKSILMAAAERFPRLAGRARNIGDFRALLADLEGKILPDGSVADNASVALHRLRREIERQKRAIQESLEKFLREHRDDGILQEEIVTIRNERFVVPIISGQRRKMNGVIHGASSTGHTLFVEPLATIDLNNELVRLTEEELREVHRILREMTAKLRAQAAPIRASVTTMGELDWVFAKARFGTEFNCSIPRFTGRLALKNSRHPLLEDVLRQKKRKVMPISLTLDADCRTLLISGPNTGGKTVTLKTVGLLALMAQSGLPVPAEDAEFPIFEQVLADIGDQQSIEASLSTFSAHVSHIREMALDATPDSLVLLDEIGSSTDPEEGGALGVAVVEHFRAAGAYTLASTHLLALKVYGANTKSVLNASMGFDEATLEPTYQLRLGLPGKSAGLDIAMRLGMPEDIMKRARASLSSHEAELARLLTDLHARLEDVQRADLELRRKQDDLVVREKRMQQIMLRTESEKIIELEERFQEFQNRFAAEAQQTIAKLTETADSRKAGEQAQRQVNRTTRELRESFDQVIAGPQPTASKPRLQIEEGVRVRIRNLREVARVRRKISEELIEVEIGFMKMQVPLSDVEEVLPPAVAGQQKLPKNVTLRSGPDLVPVQQELNVIGQRAEEASDNVERFLDSAVMATASRVRIVHGHGMGVLKRAIAELLRDNPHVEKFYAAPASEGGGGATIVDLKI